MYRRDEIAVEDPPQERSQTSSGDWAGYKMPVNTDSQNQQFSVLSHDSRSLHDIFDHMVCIIAIPYDIAHLTLGLMYRI